MPEYALPYAIYLLCFCKETPCAGGSGLIDINKDDSYEDMMEEDDYQKWLRKRLKFLLDPLVHSLGDGADNISFLLRMTEVIGLKYGPNETSPDDCLDFHPPPPSRFRTIGGVEHSPYERMKVVCSAVRETLMKLVKKDIHLTPYPGAVNIPSSLFRRINSGPIKNTGNMETTFSSDSKNGGNRVHFSPDVRDDQKHNTLRRDLDSSFVESGKLPKTSLTECSDPNISPIPPSNSSDSDSCSPVNSRDKRKRAASRIKSPRSQDSSEGHSIAIRPSMSNTSQSSLSSARIPLSDTNSRDLKRSKSKTTSISVSLDSKFSDGSAKARGAQLKIQSSRIK
jgi:hypothetical protein